MFIIIIIIIITIINIIIIISSSSSSNIVTVINIIIRALSRAAEEMPFAGAVFREELACSLSCRESIEVSI